MFGGTFDPIHIGHLAATQDAATQLSLNRVIFVPNRVPPHKLDRGVSDVQDRVRMVELAIADNPLFELSMLELEREGPSYTLETLRILRRGFPADVEMYFLTGVDSLHGLHTWHEPEQLLDEFRVVLLDRPVATQIDWLAVEMRFPSIREQAVVISVPRLEISAEDLRRRVSDGRSIRYYVLPVVEEYIRERGMYLTTQDAP